MTCPECGNKVSSLAEKCIHCGYPINDLASPYHDDYNSYDHRIVRESIPELREFDKNYKWIPFPY